MTDTTIALDLTWAHLDQYVADLADRIRADGVPQVVVGVLRGGMVPAVLLAHQLGVRDLRALEVTRTLSERPNGEKSPRPVITNPASVGTFTQGADVLLVDDVAGSGDTLDTAHLVLTQYASRVRRAVLVVNTVNWNAARTRTPHEIQDYIGTTCAGWVRFPWEVR